MKVISAIIEALTSPFTLLFRTKATKNNNKEVNIFLVLLISLVITAAVLLIFYYKRLF